MKAKYAPNRLELLMALAALPDEAFTWLAVAVTRSIFPEGLGGFRDEARFGIIAAQRAAQAYIEPDSKP